MSKEVKLSEAIEQLANAITPDGFVGMSSGMWISSLTTAILAHTEAMIRIADAIQDLTIVIKEKK